MQLWTFTSSKRSCLHWQVMMKINCFECLRSTFSHDLLIWPYSSETFPNDYQEAFWHCWLLVYFFIVTFLGLVITSCFLNRPWPPSSRIFNRYSRFLLKSRIAPWPLTIYRLFFLRYHRALLSKETDPRFPS
jgi:hypothetical protein